jgi:YARHG domain
MLKRIYLIGIASLLFACGGTQDEQKKSEETAMEEEIMEEELLASVTMDPRTFGGDKHESQTFIDDMYPSSDPTPDKILGSYIGEFGKNMINITLFKIENGKAEGFSVCAGNFRKIEGSMDLMQDDEYTFDMNEPGDDAYDGNFVFTLDASDETIIGKWTPFKEKGTSKKSYKLEKREFNYDPSVGDWPESSQGLLADEDVNYLGEDELATMRNEIYARHGYSFKDKSWRYYFEGRDWYMPMGVDIREKLTDVEVANIELIYQYESYYEEYYDDYGR